MAAAYNEEVAAMVFADSRRNKKSSPFQQRGKEWIMSSKYHLQAGVVYRARLEVRCAPNLCRLRSCACGEGLHQTSWLLRIHNRCVHIPQPLVPPSAQSTMTREHNVNENHVVANINLSPYLTCHRGRTHTQTRWKCPSTTRIRSP